MTCNPPLSPAIAISTTVAALQRRPLRIALLGYRSHPHVGGQGIYLHYLSKALTDLGHSVDVISGPPYPELDERVTLIKIPSLNLYASENHVRALRWHHLRSFTDTWEWWTMLTGGFGEPYTFGRRLVKWFAREKPEYDIVHDNQSLCYGLLALQKKYALVATVHHPITRDRDIALAAATGKGHRWLIKRWYSFLTMQQKVVNKLQHVITVSQTSRDDIAQEFGRPAEKIQVIANGVDTNIFKPRSDIARKPFQLITTASSDQPLKGLSVLLQALHQLQNNYPQINLTVIGKLNPGGSTEKELQSLQLAEKVNFVSELSREEIVALYAEATMAIVPSRYEGFGLPALEAMACGTPLICSNGGALPEVVGEAAFVVPAGDVDALKLAITNFLIDEKLRQHYAAAGLQYANQHYRWEVIAGQLADYYYQLLPPEERHTTLPTATSHVNH